MIAKTDVKLNKDKILSTEARRALFQGLMQGFNLKEAAKQAKLSHQTAKQYHTKFHFNELVRQEKAIIEQKAAERLGLTVEDCLQQFLTCFDMSVAANDRTNALRATENIAKIRGAYEADNLQKANKLSLADAMMEWSRSTAGQKWVESHQVEVVEPAMRHILPGPR